MAWTGIVLLPGVVDPILSKWAHAVLEIEQGALAFQAASVAGERPVGADDAVAGDDDGDRVAAIGGADRARGPGALDALGELAVADRLAVGDRAQRLPDLLLERRAGERQVDVEVAPVAGEVLGELGADPGEGVVVALPAGGGRAVHVEQLERGAVPGEEELADGAVGGGVDHAASSRSAECESDAQRCCSA